MLNYMELDLQKNILTLMLENALGVAHLFLIHPKARTKDFVETLVSQQTIEKFMKE